MLRARSPGGQRPQVGELDALAALARDLAAEDGARAQRRDEAAEPVDAGVGAQLARLAEPTLER